jgi:Lon protease-like protein
VTKRYDDGRMDLATEGVRRFSIVQLNHDRDFLQAEVTYFDDDEPLQAPQTDQETALQLHQQLFDTLDQDYELDRNKPLLSFQLVNLLPVDLDFKQSMLEMKSERERIETLIEYYRVTIPQVEKTIRTREKASGNGHVS